MARVWVLVAFLAFNGPVWSQRPPKDSLVPYGPPHGKAAEGMVCTIYPLSDLGDEELAGWIAATIPSVVEPHTWAAEGKASLSFNRPKKLLAVYQTPAVHAKVESFLKDLKKSLPAEKTARATPKPVLASFTTAREPLPVAVSTGYPTPPVIPTAFVPPPAKPLEPPSKSTAYPVPAPVQPPKHLFHFVIRYEGDGVVDANVAEVVKSVAEKSTGVTVETKETAKEPPKAATPFNSLFHVILRYEGDGIIDSNVSSLLRDLVKLQQGAQGQSEKAPEEAPKKPKEIPTSATGLRY